MEGLYWIVVDLVLESRTHSWFYPGFNVETVEYKNISFTVWDVGGQDKVCYIFCTSALQGKFLAIYLGDMMSFFLGVFVELNFAPSACNISMNYTMLPFLLVLFVHRRATIHAVADILLHVHNWLLWSYFFQFLILFV